MQELIVAVIVIYAAGAVLLRYLPKRIRAHARTAMAQLFRRIGWNRAAARFEHASGAASCADGCGSCGGCGSGDDARSADRSAISPQALRRTARR